MNFLRNFFLTPRFFIAVGANVALFVLGYFFSAIETLSVGALCALTALLLLDGLLLYGRRIETLAASRLAPKRFSNGDDNPIHVSIQNPYSFTASVSVIDELPAQFQRRDFLHALSLPARGEKTFSYSVRPTKRGEYHFGALNVFVSSPLGLVSRRFTADKDAMIPTYPSYVQMRKFELIAASSRLAEFGVKQIRRIGHTMEFERIKNYAVGDDVRAVNWKATARRSDLMVNQFQDERSQPIYSLIDMGRAMKMPFEQMTLLDYAINSALAISNIALKKQDRVGLITFSNEIHAALQAERKSGQLAKILETLYNQTTTFKESNYEALYVAARRSAHQRGLLLLYTNFETLSSMRRQLKYLQRLAQKHLLVVIFFENAELRALLAKNAQTLEDVYIKTIAEKFAYEKREIALELGRYGIQSILTAPKDLSLKTVNKYLELKARGLI